MINHETFDRLIEALEVAASEARSIGLPETAILAEQLLVKGKALRVKPHLERKGAQARIASFFDEVKASMQESLMA